jgi:uncharacterized protein (UPF0332 family)
LDVTDPAILYLSKATESLAGAEAEYENRRYNNCANRCYYACFQAAIAALLRHQIRPRSPTGQWGHDFVQAEFAGNLVGRRKLFPGELRTTLEQNRVLRVTADYTRDGVIAVEAARSLRRTQYFLRSVDSREVR